MRSQTRLGVLAAILAPSIYLLAACGGDDAAVSIQDAGADGVMGPDTSIPPTPVDASVGDSTLPETGTADAPATQTTDTGTDSPLGDAADAGIPNTTDASDSGSTADASDSASASDAPLSFDGAGLDAGGLCTAFTVNATTVVSTLVDAAAPASSTFTGGVVVSGTYWLTSQTEYPGGSPVESDKKVLIIDATHHTLQVGSIVNGGAATYAAYGYIAPTGTGNGFFISGLCNDLSTGSEQYTFSGSGTGATFTLAGSTRVQVFTKQ